MNNLLIAIDRVLQGTNAGSPHHTTLFYTDGSTLTGNSEEVYTALKEVTRSQVLAVLTHGDKALYTTLAGWRNGVEPEVLGQIETWDDFKEFLPNEYVQDLKCINAYLHSLEMTSLLDLFYERQNNKYKEEVIKVQTEALHEVLQDMKPGAVFDTTIFFTDGSYETGTIHTLADAVEGRERSEIRAAIPHSTVKLFSALGRWDSLVEDAENFDYFGSWKAFQAYSPEGYEKVLVDLWIAAKLDVERIVDEVYNILETRKGGH